MNGLILLKLTLVPALIAAVPLAGRRWGPAVAGWLSAFPVVAGPILLFMGLEQGPTFTATAAAGTLTAVLANLAFGIAYAQAASRRHAWPISLVAGWAAYALVVAALSINARPPMAYMAIVVLIALGTAPLLYPKPPVASHASSPLRTKGDLWLRMLAGALLTATVTHLAFHIGPTLSGMLAMFPVMGSVLAVFTHRHEGAIATIRLLKGMVLGYYAFSAFCIVLAITLPSWPLASSFATALLIALSIQIISRLALQHGLPGPALWSPSK
ncbi:MAG: hypothetical protein WAQ08_18065 [Aquabacterium sp.]|jgi:hypothetical protein|uniref:hypothetical protein n=1 Tax=Aquabacterium sp. TaxID=1872578 RepID=UPI003BAEDDBE